MRGGAPRKRPLRSLAVDSTLEQGNDTRPDEQLAASALEALGGALALASDVSEIGEIIDLTDAVIADSDGELRERAEAFAAKAEAKRQRALARLTAPS